MSSFLNRRDFLAVSDMVFNSEGDIFISLTNFFEDWSSIGAVLLLDVTQQILWLVL